MRRFWVDDLPLDVENIVLEDALAHRLAKVLRVRQGEQLILFGGSRIDVTVEVVAVSERRIDCRVTDRLEGPAESRTNVHLYQSITKGERFEWLVEKATELGVASITPLLAARAVVKTAAGSNREDRWRRIAIEAAEQSGRSTVPDTGGPVTFESALNEAKGLLLLPYEGAGRMAPGIATVISERIDDLFALGSVSVFIGPEGGFEPSEIAAAEGARASVVTLGERVLRSETAGLVAVTLVMQALGELG